MLGHIVRLIKWFVLFCILVSVFQHPIYFPNPPSVLQEYIFKKLDVSFFDYNFDYVNLGFFEGVSNGINFIFNSFSFYIVNIFIDYYNGFDGTMNHFLWAILGLLWLPIKHVFISFLACIMVALISVLTFVNIFYYIGLIISMYVSFKVFLFLLITRSKNYRVENVRTENEDNELDSIRSKANP
ncbi:MULTISPECIES: hypothetical protein [Exiguobacterium]|uniref:hypothetical protein n=1 Tax=Exiguobacterium TaxID=33986 RepID=UPI001BE4E602|nr:MULTISPECIES: hypothetical protein [Exiguobacterium]MCT4791025.1 hypothetical protein [Exiguobacterium artemiae]